MEFEIGKILTVVGTGEEGYAGDGGPAAAGLRVVRELRGPSSGVLRRVLAEVGRGAARCGW